MRDATKQVRDELTKRGVIWGKPAPEYWELLGGMPTRDYVTTVGDVNICETTAGDLVVENVTTEQAIAAVLGPRTCRNDAKPMAQQENDRLKAENAKLISVLHEVEAEAVDAYLGLRHDCELLAGELDDRFRKYWHEQVQNEKLRKLVDGWDFCGKTKTSSFDECVGCPLFVQTPHSYRCARNELMRELGIEVDG